MTKKSSLLEKFQAAKPVIVKPPDDEIERFYDLEQGTEEWLLVRLGIPTASRFHVVMAEGKDGGESATRSKLLRILAGEIVTGRLSTYNFTNDDIERGHEDEPKAKEWFERHNFVDLRPIGFVRRPLPSGRYVGASPDAEIVGTNRALECKSLRPDLWIEQMDKPGAPAKHRAQCQGICWVGGYDAVELVLYSEGMPTGLTYLIERDDRYIAELQKAVEIFDWDLSQLVKKVRARSK